MNNKKLIITVTFAFLFCLAAERQLDAKQNYHRYQKKQSNYYHKHNHCHKSTKSTFSFNLSYDATPARNYTALSPSPVYYCPPQPIFALPYAVPAQPIQTIQPVQPLMVQQQTPQYFYYYQLDRSL